MCPTESGRQWPMAGVCAEYVPKRGGGTDLASAGGVPGGIPSGSGHRTCPVSGRLRRPPLVLSIRAEMPIRFASPYVVIGLLLTVSL